MRVGICEKKGPILFQSLQSAEKNIIGESKNARKKDWCSICEIISYLAFHLSIAPCKVLALYPLS